MKKFNFKDIEKKILPLVEHPSQYIGAEFKRYLKDELKTQIKICLIFPDLYEIGMSSLGIKLLFHYLNQFDDILVDLAFMPKDDYAKALKEHGYTLHSLGYKKPLKQFDILGFSFNYELCYTNVLAILDYAGIEMHSNKRNESDPIIIAGGGCTSNPVPMQKFIDVFVIGEGEEVLLQICKNLSNNRKSCDRNSKIQSLANNRKSSDRMSKIQSLANNRKSSDRMSKIQSLANNRKSSDRMSKIQSLAKIDGIYASKFFDGSKIKPRYIKNLDKNFFPTDIIIPYANVVHEHSPIEIQRGCFRGCKFCNSSYITRPVRTRNAELIKHLISDRLKNSGTTDISLLSLSVVDHPEIEEILSWFVDNYYDKNCSISLPSLRCDRFSLDLAELVSKNKKSALTFAPEAGSQRMRDIIGKNVSEEDIFDAARGASEAGWKLIKLYFMYGLPNETMEDIEAIVDLVKHLKKEFKQLRFNVGISSFVPKPHTPFAWEKQEGIEVLMRKKMYIINGLRKVAQVKHSSIETSIVEGLLSRGGDKAGDMVEKAYDLGARFDQWKESFDYEKWTEAAKSVGINLEEYVTGDIANEDVWGIIDYGIKKETLKSMAKKVTPYEKVDVEHANCKKKIKLKKNEYHEKFKYRIKYEKKYDIRFLSHLELVTLLKKSFVRSKLPVVFSEGFHPIPKISCASPLSVGFVGEAEWVDLELYENWDIEKIKKILNENMYFGIEIKEVREVTLNAVSLEKILKIMEYEVILDDSWDKERLKKFIVARDFIRDNLFRKSVQEVDLKNIVHTLEIKDKNELKIIINTNQKFVSLFPVLREIFGISEAEFRTAYVVRKQFWLGNGFGPLVEP